MLTGKKIVLGVTGGIAVYKACELVRLLKKEGADVQVIMTEAALQFVGKVTFQALSGHEAYSSMWNEPCGMVSHIKLREGCDLMIVAPATANLIAKVANGIADDLLTSTIIARTCPLMIAPAMNIHMWQNYATQSNVAKLKEFPDVIFSGPDSGDQACGDVGTGRFKEPADILEDVIRVFAEKPLAGKKVLLTAGPTLEHIDPVRCVTNRSSGKQGYEIARAAVRAGAEVTLVSGPTTLKTPAGVKRIDVESASQMLDAVMAETQTLKPDLFISVAAVSDWAVKNPSSVKIKKDKDAAPQIEFVKNPDILSSVAALPNAPVCIGFAAETDDIIKNATDKLHRKRVAMIVANSADSVGKDVNSAVFVQAYGKTDLGQLTKRELSERIVKKAAELLAKR